MRCSTKI